MANPLTSGSQFVFFDQATLEVQLLLLHHSDKLSIQQCKESHQVEDA